jgi:hypothetical protein
MDKLPDDVMAALSAQGWVWIRARVSPNGLVLHTLGRYPETGLGGSLRRYQEQEERSVSGWEFEAAQP